MEKKSRMNRVSVMNIVCAVLMLALLVMQFTPFWQYGEDGATASIGGYIWFPTENAEVESYLKANVDGFAIDQLVAVAVLILVLSAAGAALCLIKPQMAVTPVVTMACGLLGMYAYLAKPALRLGMHWGLYLALCAGMILLGALVLYWKMRESKALHAEIA